MKAANPSHALALVVVDELARCGITDAVLAPGSRSTALAMAFHDDPQVRLHVEIDERSAGFLAVGLAKAAGRPAAVVTTSGTATANLHPAVVEADTSRTPLLVLTADRPPELQHTGANQTIDQVKLYGDAVRWFVDVGVPEDRPGAPQAWRSAFAHAVAEAVGVRAPPGPVHVNLPFREPTVPAGDDGRAPPSPPYAAPLDGRRGRRAWTAVERAPRTIPDAELTAFAGLLAATERGLIVVGETTARPGPIHDLARATGWPVIAEPHSGARHGDHLVATAHHLLGVDRFAAAHRPALVLRVGRSGLSRPVANLLGADVPQVLVDPDGAWLDPRRAIADLVVADPDLLLSALVRLLPAPTSSDWLDGWRTADRIATEAVDAILAEAAAPTEPRTARDVAASVPDGGVLVAGSSMPIRDLDAFARPRAGVRVIGNRGASGIDGFVSTALGAALAAGSVTALVGDLSLLHDAGGFLVSPDVERLDAVFVIVNNDGGAIFHFLPQADYPSFERLFGTPHGRDLATLARFHGLGHELVTVADDLASAVEEARRGGGVRLVEVRTDRHDNLALHRRVQDAVAAALA